MDLIALLCLQCRSPLDFTGKFVSTCSACGVQHALIPSEGGLLRVVSYLPYEPKLGVMERSLKMQLIAKLRELENIAVSTESWYSKDNLVLDGQKYLYNQVIYDDDSAVSIAKMIITPVFKKGFLSYVFNPFVDFELMCNLWVLPVNVEIGQNNILAGYRIQIKVIDERFEKDSNELSIKIKDWFGVIPEISLQKI